MKNDLSKIVKKLRQVLPFIQKEYDVANIELFGSYLNKEQTEKSDLDLLVSFNKTPGLIRFIELENYLSDILKIKVDLVIKDSVKRILRDRILSNTLQL
jgi:predicted nucleotidyltransferase